MLEGLDSHKDDYNRMLFKLEQKWSTEGSPGVPELAARAEKQPAAAGGKPEYIRNPKTGEWRRLGKTGYEPWTPGAAAAAGAP